MFRSATKSVPMMAAAAMLMLALVVGLANGFCVKITTSNDQYTEGFLHVWAQDIDGTPFKLTSGFLAKGDVEVIGPIDQCIDSLWVTNPRNNGWRGTVEISEDCSSYATLDCAEPNSNCLQHGSGETAGSLLFPATAGGDTSDIWVDGDATAGDPYVRGVGRTYCLNGDNCYLDVSSVGCLTPAPTASPTCTYEWTPVVQGCCRYSENEDEEGPQTDTTYQSGTRKDCKKSCRQVDWCRSWEYSPQHGGICERHSNVVDSVEAENPIRCISSFCQTQTCNGVSPFSNTETVQGNSSTPSGSSSRSIIIGVTTAALLVIALLIVGVRVWKNNKTSTAKEQTVENPNAEIYFEADALPKVVENAI